MAFLPFIGPAVDLVNTVVKRVLPEKMSDSEKANLQQQLTLELMKADWGQVTAQLEINRVEAASQSLFVAGWRPFVGWVCGSALAYSFVLQPFLAFSIGVFAWKLPPLPALDATSLMTILAGLLGLGGMRTYEKIQGKAGNGAH